MFSRSLMSRVSKFGDFDLYTTKEGVRTLPFEKE